MLRPATPTALSALRSAAQASDLDLDLALLRLDVLAPAALDEIRDALTRPGVSLSATTNGDGHRVIEITVGHAKVALIHHDGRVQHLHPVAA